MWRRRPRAVEAERESLDDLRAAHDAANRAVNDGDDKRETLRRPFAGLPDLEQLADAAQSFREAKTMIQAVLGGQAHRPGWSHYVLHRLRELRSPVPVSSSESEALKAVLLRAHVGLFWCEIMVRERPSDATRHDEAAGMRKAIKELEKDLRGYQIANQEHLWNKLERLYNELAQESSRLGRDYETAEFEYAMMRSRKFIAKARREWLRWAMLSFVDLSIGFGHRLYRTLACITFIIILFGLAYYCFYPQLIADPAPAVPLRIWGSLWTSFAVLFAGLDLESKGQPLEQGLGFMVTVHRIVAYAVNVGLIALIVNRLAGRRKW